MQQSLTLNTRVKAWFSLSRAPFHSVGVLPFLLGAVIAWGMGWTLNWGVLALSTFAVVLIMLTTYLSGEHYDFETDSINRNFNKFSGGSRILQSGLFSRRFALVASYVSLAAAVAIGFLLQFYFETGAYTLLLGAFGGFCGFFYTVKPLQWSYRGVGEVLIAICYGWLTVNAGFYLQTGTFHAMPTLASIPVAFSIFLVILINEFPDYKSDSISNKRNLVVRFGMERMARLYIVLAVLYIVSIYIPIACGASWLIAPLSVAVLPVALWNIIEIVRKRYSDRGRLQGVCARTIVMNLGAALIYIIAFAAGV